MKLRTLGIWIALLVVFLSAVVLALPEPTEDMGLFAQDVQDGMVTRITFLQDGARVTLDDGSSYKVAGSVDPILVERLAAQGVWMTTDLESGALDSPLLGFFLCVVVVVVGLLWYFRRSASQQNATVMQLGKSTARLIADTDVPTRFTDVGGASAAKARLADVIDYLKNPAGWEAAGVRAPRGVLLEGPPGCGKTLLARAVAGEAGVPFFSVAGSEMVEMFVGIGAARVRNLFQEAAKVAPAVIFIDEIDAVGRRRGTQSFAGFAEWEQTLNQLLVSMDGFEKRANLVLIGATNRADILDPALTRPGRFDIKLKLGELNEADRTEILAIHTQGKPAQAVDLATVAREADGLSGAQLELLVNEAAMQAFRRGSPMTQDDFREARALLRRQEPDVDALDHLLQEALIRRIEPTEPLQLRVTLRGGTELEGRLLWADPKLLKLDTDGRKRLVPKDQLVALELVVPA